MPANYLIYKFIVNTGKNVFLNSSHGSWSVCICILLLFAGLYPAQAVNRPEHIESSSVNRIKNPFYKIPQWKVWRIDERPVTIGPIKLSPPSPSARRYPVDTDENNTDSGFLTFRGSEFTGHTYAGMWDDVYASLDNGHSYIPNSWHDEAGNEIPLHSQHMHLIYRLLPDPRLFRAFGFTFTSQSTQGVGHELVNNFKSIENLERNFCFANILRAGPAHTSYQDVFMDHTVDKYDAIMPCLFNSVGSSGSEVNALAKMLIVGAYLPSETKRMLKWHGLYIPTLLYLWKASLPYDVPYDNELRHRVAYAASGRSSDVRLQVQAPINQTYHRYDEDSHLRNMVRMAKNMDLAPPIALLKKLEIYGGLEQSVNKTTLRVHQKRGQTVRMRISAADSFDPQGRKLVYRWSVLYDNTPVSIETLDNGREALIIVPYNSKLPKGLTVILLTVNNGRYDSNPATINVYRPYAADNLRPDITGPADRTALAGETIQFHITSHDPEGFPSKLYRWSNEVGELKGNQFIWKTPEVSSVLRKRVHLIASDGTGSYNGTQAILTVTPTLAVIETDRSDGDAPLTVQFSATRSRDKAGNPLSYTWDFDDGQTANSAVSTHTFTNPGFYQVRLTTTGPFGAHTVQQVIHVRHTWPLVLDNGWRRGVLRPELWTPVGTTSTLSINNTNRINSLRIFNNEKNAKGEVIGVESVQRFEAPLYLEAEFIQLYAHEGTGFEVLGTLIGKLGGPKPSDISIGYQQADGQWTRHPIGLHLKADPLTTQLRLFVDHDPNHAGRIRYTGYVESKLGRHFFRLDDQPKRDNRLRIVSYSRPGKFDIHRLRLWSPIQ